MLQQTETVFPYRHTSQDVRSQLKEVAESLFPSDRVEVMLYLATGQNELPDHITPEEKAFFDALRNGQIPVEEKSAA